MTKAQLKFLMSKQTATGPSVWDIGVARARRENGAAWESAVAAMSPKMAAAHRSSADAGEAHFVAGGK